MDELGLGQARGACAVQLHLAGALQHGCRNSFAVASSCVQDINCWYFESSNLILAEASMEEERHEQDHLEREGSSGSEGGAEQQIFGALIDASVERVVEKVQEQLAPPPSRIPVISSDPIQCITSVFKVWKKRATKPYTWSTVIEVLNAPAVDEIRLAKELTTKLSATHCSSP